MRLTIHTSHLAGLALDPSGPDAVSDRITIVIEPEPTAYEPEPTKTKVTHTGPTVERDSLVQCPHCGFIHDPRATVKDTGGRDVPAGGWEEWNALTLTMSGVTGDTLIDVLTAKGEIYSNQLRNNHSLYVGNIVGWRRAAHEHPGRG